VIIKDGDQYRLCKEMLWCKIDGLVWFHYIYGAYQTKPIFMIYF
jgi:hypothetical protein